MHQAKSIDDESKRHSAGQRPQRRHVVEIGDPRRHQTHYTCSEKSHEDVEIEERDPDEIRIINGEYVTVPDAKVYNPAFDVTPPELVTAIITDKGIVHNPTEEKMLKLRDS